MIYSVLKTIFDCEIPCKGTAIPSEGTITIPKQHIVK